MRRRLEQEKIQATQYAATAFARDMLSVKDNLERALSAIPEELREDEKLKGLVAGIEVTSRELDSAFQRHGISRIEAMGKPLDPHMHQAMLEVPSDEEPGTIVMINLLRFRQRAVYPPDFDARPCTGGDAYQRYAEVALEKVHAAGGRALWLGNVALSVIAPEGEEWNEAVLVEYPSRKAFLDMIGDPDWRTRFLTEVAANRELAG